MSEESVVNLLPHLFPEMSILPPSAYVFDRESELPHWLRDAHEDRLCPVDAAAATGETTKTYWVKFFSADAFRDALQASSPARKEELSTLPLKVYVMPTTSLLDAYRLTTMAAGTEQLPVRANLSIYNQLDLDNKLSAFYAANGLVSDINETRNAVEEQARHLAALAEPKVKNAEEMMATYQEAKRAYEALPETIPSEKQVKMFSAASRLFAAQQVARVMQDAATSMASLAESLANKAADLC